jgi:hypothetical protein
MLVYLLTAATCSILVVPSIIQRSWVSLSFALLCICSALWATKLFLLSYMGDVAVLSPLFHLLRLGMFLIAPMLLLFALLITGTRSDFFFNCFIASATVSLTIYLTNNFFLPSTLILDGQSYTPVPDIIYLIHQVNFVVSSIASICIVVVAYHRTVFTEKKRLYWIAFAQILAVVFGVLSFSFSKAFGMVGIVACFFVLANALLRYRFIASGMAVSRFVSKGVACLTLVVGYLLIEVVIRQNSLLEEHHFLYFNLMFLIVCALLYYKLEAIFQSYFDELLVEPDYELDKEKTNILDQLSHCIDGKELKLVLDNIFLNLIRVRDYTVYIKNKNQDSFNSLTIDTGSVDTSLYELGLLSFSKLTFYEERDANKSDFVRLNQSAFIPVHFKTDVMAIITLGEPTKREQYTHRDISLLSWLGEHLGETMSLTLKYHHFLVELAEARRAIDTDALFSSYNQDARAPVYNVNAQVGLGGALSVEDAEQLVFERSDVESGLDSVIPKFDIVNGNNSSVRQFVDLNQSIRNVYGLFSTEVEKFDLNLGYIPTLFACQDMVEVLLSNLFKNAIASCSGEAVCLRVETSYNKVDNTILFVFGDNGEGIAAELVDFLTSQDQTLKEYYGESSVGLIKDIVDELNGELNVQREIGNGTTFTFALPPSMRPIH